MMMAQKYGYMANDTPGAATATATPCLGCDDPEPTYSWTDYSGEGYCTRCGVTYQLKWGTLAEGETYPRCNVKEEWLPAIRAFYAETGELCGAGSVMVPREYPEIMRGRKAFEEWIKEHPEMVPETPPGEETT